MRIRRVLAFLLFAMSILQLSLVATLAEPPSPEASGKPSPSMLDGDGHPLPPGAKYRLGTRNWRHFGRGYSICFSPDGKTLALISRPRELYRELSAECGRLDIGQRGEAIRYPYQGLNSSHPNGPAMPI